MITETELRVALEASELAYGYQTAGDGLGQYGYERVVAGEFVDPNTGFHVQIYKNPTTNHYIVAFSGTEPTTGQDVHADLNLGINQWLSKRSDVFAFLDNAGATDVHFAGHSLGGGLAIRRL